MARKKKPSQPAAQLTTPESGLARRHVALAASLIAVVTALVYANSFAGQFVFDDQVVVVSNPDLALWPPAKALTGPPDSPSAGRPVVALSLALNHALGGLDVWGYHAFNLAIHVLAALALLGVARRTLSLDGIASSLRAAALPLATATALLWAVHPLQTQSVTYVSQRAESLMGLFFLLTLYGAIRFFEDPGRRKWLAAAVAACALGMLSKEVTATAPILVLLYDRAFVSGTLRAAWTRHRALYLGLAATWILFLGLLATAPRGRTTGFGFENLTALDYLRTQANAVVGYLKLSFWPDPLVLDYGWPIARELGDYLPAALFLTALLAVTVWLLRVRPRLGFLGAWFFLILAPSSSVLPIESEIVAEHRMYLPLAAVVAAAVLAVWGLLARLPTAGVRRAAGAGLATVAVAALGFATVERNRDYHSEVALWQDNVRHVPDNHRARLNLGDALRREGRFREAAAELREAVRLRPGYARAHYNLALTLEAAGEHEAAEEAYREALSRSPEDRRSGQRLATLRVQDGMRHLERGAADAALAAFDEAIALDPTLALAHYQRGRVLAAQGRLDDAVASLRAAVERDEIEMAAPHNDLGTLLAMRGETDEALGHFRRAVEIDPTDPDGHYNLGLARAQKGELDAASEHYRRALALRPQWPEALNDLARILIATGAAEEALSYANTACELTGYRVPPLLETLALALERSGRAQDAARIRERLAAVVAAGAR